MMRFWSKVKKGGPEDCWEWCSSKTARGYGTFFWNKGARYAHRISKAMECGFFADGLSACHSCDNPGCVNPAHVYWGTQSQNMKDIWDRNIIAREKYKATFLKGRSKSAQKKRLLGQEDAREIRRLAANDNLKAGVIARRYGVGNTTVQQIINGRTYKESPPGE